VSEIVIANNWDFLKEYTDARIALGRVGNSIPTAALLKFQLAHAMAKDAVYSALDITKLKIELSDLGLNVIELHSKAQNREEYLKRPDLGRSLNSESFQVIHNYLKALPAQNFDLSIVLVDGLSSQAIQTNAIPFLIEFVALAKNENWMLAPISIVSQGRVAIGDDVASALKAEIVVVMIGERPGLSSPDSMGIYLTYKPLTGFTDESRNCISNIRPKGLSYQEAAQALYYLVKAAKSLKLSGVNLKEDLLLGNVSS
jgi:ethanolamine ammonia-lyase small subunit